MKRNRVWEIPAHYIRHMQAGLRLKQTVSTDQCRVDIITQLTQVIPASLLPLSDVDNGTALRRRTTANYRQPSTSTVLWTVSYSLCSFPANIAYYRFLISASITVLSELCRSLNVITTISAIPRHINNITQAIPLTNRTGTMDQIGQNGHIAKGGGAFDRRGRLT